MRRPSIRFRLLAGTGIFVTLVLIAANVAIYRGIERTLRKEVRLQLLQSAWLLAKSAELEATGISYEWHVALASSHTQGISGLFEFTDLTSGKHMGSPDLKGEHLPIFHGALDQRVFKDIILPDGRPAQAIGLYHYPFLDADGREEMERAGHMMKPEDFPQVVVVARETESLEKRLAEMRGHLAKGSIATLVATWLAILFVASWSLRPIKELTSRLLKRSTEEDSPVPEIPANLPVELSGLAQAFNTALTRAESSRARERDFARHAAHELRTPVAGIQATLEQAIHRPRSNEELNERIAAALRLTEGMRVTLNSLMRLARLRGGLEAVMTAPFDPAALVREQLAATSAIGSARGLTIQADVPIALPALSTDAGLFRVLITNLIENAMRYAPAKSVVKVSASDTPGAFLFSVTNDRGELKPQDRERLFEPFQRGSVAADSEGGHAGLGLSLSREIASLLSGKLEMRFDDERTVTFAVLLAR
jgi:signal transduction histidine kinase